MRFVAELQVDCGPGEVWWIFDTATQRYTDWSLGSREATEAVALDLNTRRPPPPIIQS